MFADAKQPVRHMPVTTSVQEARIPAQEMDNCLVRVPFIKTHILAKSFAHNSFDMGESARR